MVGIIFAQIAFRMENIKREKFSKILTNTGFPRSNLAKRIGYNFTRVDFWPQVDKVKMCFRNICPFVLTNVWFFKNLKKWKILVKK